MATVAPTRADRRAAVLAVWRPHLAVAWRALWVSRVVVWISGMLAVAVWGVSSRQLDFDPSGITRPGPRFLDALLAPAARWDATWFTGIAQDGYADPVRTVFFPLYPLVSAIAGLPLGSALLGGVLVSWLCAVGGLAVVHRLALVELDGDEDAARLAVWSLALFPSSLFLTAAYSEALFLLLSAGALLAAREDRWMLAGLLGAGAAATRSAGLVLVFPLALLWWDARRRGRPASVQDLLLAVVLVPAGQAAYCLFLWADGTDPAAPFEQQEVWFRTFAGPFGGVLDGVSAGWDGIRQLASGSRDPVFFEQSGGDPFIVAGHNLRNLVFLVLAGALVAGAARRLAPAHAAYAIAALALPLSYPASPQPLMSLPRFVLVLVPLFLVLGAWLARAGPRRRAAYLGTSGAVLALFSAQFATWHFVA